MEITNLFYGWKTIGIGLIVSAIAIAVGPMAFDVPGVAVGDDRLGWGIAGLTAILVRQGIAKNGLGK